MKKIILIGGGGHCHSVIDVIEMLKGYSILGIIDNKKNIRCNVMGYPILGPDSSLREYIGQFSHAMISLGQIKTPAIRISIFKKIKNLNLKICILKSPLSYVSKYATLSEGAFVMHGALINAKSSIGLCTIINTAAVIDHDVTIGDFCHVSTGAKLNGGVILGNGTFIGSGAIIHHGVKIGENCIIGAGCVVKKNISDSSICKYQV